MYPTSYYLFVSFGFSVLLFLFCGMILNTKQPLTDFFLSFIAVQMLLGKTDFLKKYMPKGDNPEENK